LEVDNRGVRVPPDPGDLREALLDLKPTRPVVLRFNEIVAGLFEVSPILCRERRGDLVWTPDGPATVLFAVELRTKARSQPMVQIGRLSITPWHPIRRNGEWIFPAHVHGYQDRLVNTVYNLVLSRGHVIDVEGVQCVTLAHGFVDPVVKHDFFGTHVVVESMQRQPGFTEGRPVFENLVAIKNEDGVVNRWVDHVIREGM
jgi:hypothetical protein